MMFILDFNAYEYFSKTVKHMFNCYNLYIYIFQALGKQRPASTYSHWKLKYLYTFIFILYPIVFAILNIYLISRSMASTEFSYLQIPLEDVVKATNNFANENIIGQRLFGKVYRGELASCQIFLHGDQIVVMGKGTFSCGTRFPCFLVSSTHTVSMIGFCDERSDREDHHILPRCQQKSMHVSKRSSPHMVQQIEDSCFGCACNKRHPLQGTELCCHTS